MYECYLCMYLVSTPYVHDVHDVLLYVLTSWYVCVYVFCSGGLRSIATLLLYICMRHVCMWWWVWWYMLQFSDAAQELIDGG